MGIAPKRALIFFTKEGGNSDKFDNMHLIDVNSTNTVYNYTSSLSPYGKPGLLIQGSNGKNYCSTMPEHCFYTEEVYDLYNYDWTLEFWIYVYNTFSHKSVVSLIPETVPDLIKTYAVPTLVTFPAYSPWLCSLVGSNTGSDLRNAAHYVAITHSSTSHSMSVFVDGTKMITGTVNEDSLTNKRLYFGGGHDAWAHSIAYLQFNPVVKYTENFTPPTKDDYEGGGQT